jgi:hypothetical protein
VGKRFRALIVAAVAASDGEPASVATALEWAYEEVQRQLPGASARLREADVDRLVYEAVEFAAAMSLTNLDVQRPAVLAHEERLVDHARDQVSRGWGKVIAELRLLRAVSLEVGEHFHRRQRVSTALHDALVRMHARGITVSGEVIALLEEGYASGAIARWRTLHELSVAARFVLDHGEPVAQRWLAHRVVVRHRNALEYERHAAALGLEAIGADRLRETEQERDAALATYGRSFKGDYGWAADALDKERPTFRDLEDATTEGRLRPFYQYASHRVHAGSHGVLLEVMRGDERAMMIGPSPEGLTDPAQLTAMSMVELTTTLLMSGRGSGMQERIAVQALESLLERLAVHLERAEHQAGRDAAPELEQRHADRPPERALLAWPALSREDYLGVLTSALARGRDSRTPGAERRGSRGTRAARRQAARRPFDQT